MFPKCVGRPAELLAAGPHLNKARAKDLADIVIGAAESKSVLLSENVKRPVECLGSRNDE